MPIFRREFVASHVLALLLFGVSYFSYVYFTSNLSNPNAISRIALSLSLIDRHRVDIDPFADLTVDKATDGVHFYSDKAPGLSFLALPAALTIRPLVDPVSSGPPWHDGLEPNLALLRVVFFCAALTSAFLTACSVVVFRKVVMQLTGNASCATVLALIFGLATPIWFWGATFFGHSAAAALLLMGFYVLLTLERSMRAEDPAIASSKRTVAALALLGGAAMSWAVLVEFTAAVPMAMTFAYFSWRYFRAQSRRVGLVPAAMWIAAGGLPALVLLLVYNTIAFGSPFHIGYENVSGFEGMHQGFFGISLPRPRIMLELLMGDAHGILWLSPVLALSFIGLGMGLVSPETRGLSTFCGAIIVYYLALNSGYVYWGGGNSAGPRHITACLPFACLLLTPVWEGLGRYGRTAICAFGLLSFALCLAVVCVKVSPPTETTSALFGYILPRFWKGEFSATFPDAVLGLSGFAILIPYSIVCLLGLIGIILAFSASTRVQSANRTVGA